MNLRSNIAVFGNFTRKGVATIVLSTVLIVSQSGVSAQEPGVRYKVEGGVRTSLTPAAADSSAVARDSIVREASPVEIDTTTTARERRRLEREARDTVTGRYSRLFRDTMPISRVCAISAIAPGFGQLYNKQAWKIPILYGTVATTAYFAFQQNSKYRGLKRQYDAMKRENATQEETDPIQSQMIRHNTARTLLFVGAIGSYLYFIGDAAICYKGPVNSVKKATTLSTICPGAGQIYNKSYWKMPIILGGIATMGYVINFNNRGYERFKLAYDQVAAGKPDEFNGRYTADYLRKLKNNYRRNRDLCIIITAGLYLLNIIDAHVDAHMKDYDVSDDLSMTLEPTVTNFYTMRTGNSNGYGLSFKLRF